MIKEKQGYEELETTIDQLRLALEQRTQELSVINSVQEGLARKMDIQAIYNLVGDRIRDLFHAQVVIIASLDKETGVEHFKYFIEKGERAFPDPRPFDKLRRHMLETKEKIVINEKVEEAIKRFGMKAVHGTEVPKSLLFVPLVIGDGMSYVSLQNIDQEHAFSETDIALLETLANSMSLALENARLFDESNRLLRETEQGKAELAVINSVQEALVREMNIDGIYNLVGSRIRDLFNAQVVIIATFDHENKVEIFNYHIEKGKLSKPQSRPFDKVRQHLIQTGQNILINENFEKAAAEFGMRVVPGTEAPKSLLFMPMTVGNKVTGYVSLQNIDQEHAFSFSDVRLLSTLANSMSVALQNARLFDETNRLLKETEQRNAELAVINSVQESLVAQLDMSSIYELVGEKIRRIFDAQVIDIVTYDRQNNQIEDQYSYEKGDRTRLGKREPQGFRKHVIETGQTIVINRDHEKYRIIYGNTVSIGETPKSLVLVPMIAGGEVTGVISLQNLDHENAFSESDVSLLTTLVNSMSVALESARLFDETNRLLKETEQRTAELAVINSVQEGLVREMDMQGIYNLVGDRVQNLFNAQVVIIASFDLVQRTESFNYFFEKGQKFKTESRPIGRLRQQLIDEKRTIYIDNEYSAIHDYGLTVIAGTDMPKSLLYVPLIASNEIRGYVSLQNIDTENAFSPSDIRLLETLSNSMSVALENARLFDETNRLLKETEQRTAELSVINSVQEGLARELDMQAIYDLVGDCITNVFNAQAMIIATLDPEARTEDFKYAIEKGERFYLKPRPYDKLRQHLIDTKERILINHDFEGAAARFGMNVVPGTEHPKSLLFVPLIIGDKVKSYVSLQNVDHENAFSDADVRLLETLSNSMSVALENARLFDETNRLLKETEQRTGELAVINSVQEGLVREMNIEAIYNLVGDRLCSLFPDTQTLVIRTFDHEKGLEHWQYAIEKGVRLYSDPRPFNWANKLIIQSRKHIYINENYVETAHRYGGSGVTKGKPPKSALFVPMIVGDVVKGSVSLQNVDMENAFSEADLRLLTTLTNSMSVALENARLFDETNRLLRETEQRASELSTVNSISKALAAQLNPLELINFVGDSLKNLFRANIVYLAQLNPRTRMITFPYQYGDNMAPMKLGEGLTSKIIVTGEPLLINKDVQELRTQMGVQLIGLPAASYLGVPIPFGEEIIGVLSVQSTEQENRFNESDLRLLTTIAASVGVALRNAKLFEEVQQAKMEAETASKTAEKANEAKSAFLSTVSHELRTPLTSVLGFAKIIRKRLEEKVFPAVEKTEKINKSIQQISENLDVVISEGERLTHLINDVLDLAKIEAGKMEWNFESVSLTEVAERAVMATSALFDQKPLRLEKHIEKNLPPISGDRDKLIQVIINLISNAVKFSNEGTITCTVHRENDELVVSVSDTGIGIAPEDFSAVFEQFKQVGGDTLTDKPKGTGLGLPICKQIIEHHGGRIWLESTVGRGSTFYFALPVLAPTVTRTMHLDELVRQLKEQMAGSALQTGGKVATILIVDDDESIRSLLRQELTDAGYLVDEAANGKNALEQIRHNRPDLIILDVMMPEMNGFDVAAILKNDPQTLDIPIIVLSIIQDKIRGYRIGVDRYLTKPIDTAQLFSEVGSLLEQGKSRKKVMVVDEDSTAVRSLTDVLEAKGYSVVESDGHALVEKAIATQPDIIILNSMQTGKSEVQALRFEKGLENVLFLMYQ